MAEASAVCRCCACPADDEPLILPCACEQPVHESCLRRWCAFSGERTCAGCSRGYVITGGDTERAFGAALLMLARYAAYLFIAATIGGIVGYVFYFSPHEGESIMLGVGFGVAIVSLVNLMIIIA